MNELMVKLLIPTSEEVNQIEDELMAYNLKEKPMTQELPYRSINRYIRDHNGKLLGGAIIATSVLWHILYIDTI
jgi:hypothetical protein